ncbi:hypothetical protein [Massilia sp. DD77]|uniref:hypothetical protein n=1 Tax=Massilia sp. DD77 TaxID=3109349 RepID=UPI002FFFD616
MTVRDFSRRGKCYAGLPSAGDEFTIKKMLKTAVVNVLKRSWMLLVCIAAITVSMQTLRDTHVSFIALVLILLAALLAVGLVALPVEMHKLRNGRH